MNTDANQPEPAATPEKLTAAVRALLKRVRRLEAEAFRLDAEHTDAESRIALCECRIGDLEDRS